MPFETSDDAHDESLALLPDAAEWRPYQPYCVTEASSRAQSPDPPLIPRPLRSTPVRAQGLIIGADSQLVRRAASVSSLDRSAASSPDGHDSLAILHKPGSKIEIQHSSSNPMLSFGDTQSVISNHIAQAVTPRGSRSLASVDETVYDNTPSHPRMQRQMPSPIVALQKIDRKPLPWNSKHSGMSCHPLPPLPFRANADQGLSDSTFKPRGNDFEKDRLEETWESTQTSCRLEGRSDGHLLLLECSLSKIPRHPIADTHKNDPPIPLSRGISFKDELESSNIKVLHDTCFTDSNRNSQQRNIPDEHAQYPSSAALYTSHDRLQDNNDERTAHRRTRPKDAKLRYQFGQIPARGFDLPPPTPPHLKIHRQPIVDYCISATPSSSLHQSTDKQGGPRAPPWGDYESLEMRRQRRGDARERAQARLYRIQRDRASLCQESPPVDSFGNADMREEVEGFREQVLSLYPEIEFNREAGVGGRACCCIAM